MRTEITEDHLLAGDPALDPQEEDTGPGLDLGPVPGPRAADQDPAHLVVALQEIGHETGAGARGTPGLALNRGIAVPVGKFARSCKLSFGKFLHSGIFSSLK